ncbi:MAG TPA: type II toxin-antitoxin system HicA family toxin [Candidatus Limnocylindria bacterium]|nr:type II toxin-antitoxin system HicA family toxin [Candidatus Limnocylindria bacterium]
MYTSRRHQRGGSTHSRVVLAKLQADGWVVHRIRGSHHHLRHPTKPGTVTVPHPVRDIPKGTLRSIERQSGLSFNE